MSLPFMTAKQQENICSELPVLHSSRLELLTAIIKCTGRYVYDYTIASLSLKKKKENRGKREKKYGWDKLNVIFFKP